MNHIWGPRLRHRPLPELTRAAGPERRAARGPRHSAGTRATNARADAMGGEVLVAGRAVDEPTLHDLGPHRVRRKSARRPQLADESQRPSTRIHAGQRGSEHQFRRSEASPAIMSGITTWSLEPSG